MEECAERIKVDIATIEGRKYIDMADLVCWLRAGGYVTEETIGQLEELRRKK